MKKKWIKRIIFIVIVVALLVIFAPFKVSFLLGRGEATQIELSKTHYPHVQKELDEESSKELYKELKDIYIMRRPIRDKYINTLEYGIHLYWNEEDGKSYDVYVWDNKRLIIDHVQYWMINGDQFADHVRELVLQK